MEVATQRRDAHASTGGAGGFYVDDITIEAGSAVTPARGSAPKASPWLWLWLWRCRVKPDRLKAVLVQDRSTPWKIT